MSGVLFVETLVILLCSRVSSTSRACIFLIKPVDSPCLTHQALFYSHLKCNSSHQSSLNFDIFDFNLPCPNKNVFNQSHFIRRAKSVKYLRESLSRIEWSVIAVGEPSETEHFTMPEKARTSLPGYVFLNVSLCQIEIRS